MSHNFTNNNIYNWIKIEIITYISINNIIIMASALSFVINYDLTYILSNINNAVIAVSMEKFISLKQHLTDEYNNLIKMYPNSVSPYVELEKKKLHNYFKTDEDLVINSIYNQLCIFYKYQNIFELVIKSAFYLIDKHNLDSHLKIKYNNHFDVLAHMIVYIKYDMLLTFCKIDATKIQIQIKQLETGLSQSEKDEIDKMNMSQLINAREASNKRSYMLALDDSIFTNIETFDHSTYYTSYVIHCIEYLEANFIPDMD
jgi:hypothetical protein